MTNTPLDPAVEMYINGAWVDITDDCRLDSADSGGGITITRGRPNEGGTAEPTQLDFTLNNIGGKYSPKNPNSIYSGLIGRNQPVRVALDRRTDDFNNRTTVDTWGRLPDRIDREKKTIQGDWWNLTGTTGNFDITAGVATILQAGGTQVASFGDYADCEVLTKIKMSDRTSETGIVFRYQPTIKPGAADGEMENGVGDWVPTGGTSTFVSSTAQFWTGTKSGLLTVAGSPVEAGVRPVSTKRAPVKAGSSYRVRSRVRPSFTGNIFLSWDWYDADGVFLSTTTSGALPVTANTWFWVEFTATAPTGASLAGYGPTLTGSPANGTFVFVDDLLYLDFSTLTWYSAYIVPNTAPTADRLRIGKIVNGPDTTPGNVSIAFGADWIGGNYVVNTWYWIKAQASGQRFRMKFWLDGTPEPTAWDLLNYDNRTNEEAGPTHGAVGLYAANGTCVLSSDYFQVNDWRAHAEIAQLPPRWDLSRQDRWVPVTARGVLRRYGQGRKAELSAVRLHLKGYTPSGMWFPLEENTGDQASNEIEGGLSAIVKDLEFGEPELTGELAVPGIAGFAFFGKSTSSLNGQALDYTTADNDPWTIFFFFRIPAGPATALTQWISVSSTGTARFFRFQINPDRSFNIQALGADGTVLSSDSAVPYSTYPGVGWLAASLYVNPNGGNVDWAFDYHQPGDDLFYSANGSYAGTCGRFRSVYFRSSADMETAGGFYLSQLFHYDGRLPFVSFTFARAAKAYDQEEAVVRWTRLTSDAGIPATIRGFPTGSEPMGPQLPQKLMDLLEECATAEDGFIMEERDSFALALHTRLALYNTEVLPLNIDSGHLSPPLEPVEDDQGTRNDITVTRPNGGFRRSVQTIGPLNTQDPGVDADSVGVYDSSFELNLGSDNALQPAADFFLARGTIDEARYPSIVADLVSSVYQADRALTVLARSVDSGRQIDLSNSEVSPNTSLQIVQSYTEKIDQYEHTLSWVTQPGRVYQGGVTGSSSKTSRYRYEARVQPAGIVTQALFVVGTDTEMLCEATAGNRLWYPTADDPKVADFDIMVDGVRLRLRSVGRNVAVNSDFESTLTGTWTPSGGGFALSRDANDPYAGLRSCRTLASGAGTGGPVQDPAASSFTTAAADYVVCGWVKTEAAATDFRFAVDWYQTDNITFISTSLPTPIVTVANTWTWYSALVTAPALAVRARAKGRNVFAGATNMWVDDLRLLRVSSYNSTPQSIMVDQAPLNGVFKTIAAGKRITLAKPARVAW